MADVAWVKRKYFQNMVLKTRGSRKGEGQRRDVRLWIEEGGPGGAVKKSQQTLNPKPQTLKLVLKRGDGKKSKSVVKTW